MSTRLQRWALVLPFLVACAGAPSPPATTPGPARPDAPGERAAFDLARRLPPAAGALDPAWYAAARNHHERMARFSTVAGRAVGAEKSAARWEFLGPSNVGGRTRTLVFDPRNPARMLAGGVSGGVFETTDGGLQWRALSDDASNLNIGALAIDPSEPDIVYAGTGELYRNSERPYASMWGMGILRSTDGGRSFQPLLATSGPGFRYVSDIVVSPLDPRRIYAATNSGVWRSDDRGASFVEILRPVDPGGAPLYEGCTDLEILPGSDTLLASCASRSEDDRYWLPGSVVPPTCGGPCPATVFRTEDARGTPQWQVVLSEAGMGRTSLAVAPSNPQIVYALAASVVPGPDRNGDGRGDYDNGLHALFRSDDGGRTFGARLRNSSSDVLSTYLLSYADGFEAQRCGFGSFWAYGAGWYNQAIAVNPLDPETVWVAGMEVYRSNDGGLSFGKASYWWLDGLSPFGTHADVHLIRFHPQYAQGTRRMFLTSDGGVAYTDRDDAPVRRGADAACGAGDGVVPWVTIERGLASTQFYSGAVSRTASLWLGGTQDNGTLLQTPQSNQGEFVEVLGGDGATVAIDPRNDRVVYASYQNVNLHRSVDGGFSFVRATNGISDTPIFIMPFVIDEAAPDRLYAAGTRLWRTSNQGRNWSAASAAFGSDFKDRISALAVAPTNSAHLLAGNHRGIYRSTHATALGASSVLARATPREGWVSSLTFDPVDANVAYATYSTFGGAHVWKSTDAGATWSAIDGSGNGALPDIPVHHLVIDPGHRERLYIGTDLGVYVSLDGGGNWARETGGFADVIVERLAIAPEGPGGLPWLYAYTYGRGVWRAPLGDFDGVPSYRIGPELSGAFYDPAQDGHGLILEAIDLGGVTGIVATWYTYVDGRQAWLVGAAEASGKDVRIPMTITRGADFGAGFDPADVVREPWGELRLSFDSADAGRAEWSSTRPGFGNGSMPLVRLTRVASAGSGALQACASGSWYQPAQDGHGLQMEIVGEGSERQAVVVWFTYADGEQRWLTGAGPITGDRATIPLAITDGGQFPPAFQPGQVSREPWGTLEWTGIDAGRARIQWNSTRPGFASGSLDLVRLTTLLGTPCP